MRLSVKDLRAAGIEAKWGRLTSGQPAVFVRLPIGHPHRTSNTWWLLTNHMWERIQRGEDAVEAVDFGTLLGDLFIAPV